MIKLETYYQIISSILQHNHRHSYSSKLYHQSNLNPSDAYYVQFCVFLFSGAIWISQSLKSLITQKAWTPLSWHELSANSSSFEVSPWSSMVEKQAVQRSKSGQEAHLNLASVWNPWQPSHWKLLEKTADGFLVWSFWENLRSTKSWRLLLSVT